MDGKHATGEGRVLISTIAAIAERFGIARADELHKTDTR